jgi:hypothetical protein
MAATRTAWPRPRHGPPGPREAPQWFAGVVLQDDYDPLLMAAFDAQPPELSPVQALRGAIHTALGSLSAAELAAVRERMVLAMAAPELRGASLDNLTQAMEMLAKLVARRVGREESDFAVRTFSGAVLGVMIAAQFSWVEDADADLAATLDAAIAHLEAGLPL